MDKISPQTAQPLLSQQVREARYFFLHLAPRPGRAAVALGGRERCNPDYALQRGAFAFHVLEYVAEGTGTVSFGAREERLQPGTLFVAAPDAPVAIRTTPEAPLLKYFVCVTGGGLTARLQRAGLKAGHTRTLATHAEVRSVMEDLIREGQRPGELAREICQHLWELLLLKIEDAGRALAHDDPAQENFQRCKALIDAEADRLGTLGDIAARAGLEASSVCRLFRRFQGTSPYQYLLRRKMNLAAAYLVENGGLVKEAAQHVGFADPYHFSRCFKAVHGVAPRHLLRYRQEH